MNTKETTWCSQIRKLEESHQLPEAELNFVHHMDNKLTVDLETLSKDEIHHIHELVDTYLDEEDQK